MIRCVSRYRIMSKQLIRFGLAIAASVVAIPYCVAFIANLLHGWPLGKHKFKRAFHPYKVYCLNYAIIRQKLNYLQYARLYFTWKRFYAKALSNVVVKDVFFNNKQSLDIYLPTTGRSSGRQQHPVIVFIYGGSWSSGDKNMYPLLCSQLASQLKAVVCCPNYSLYPIGFVDDMVQDIVDCLRWMQLNIHKYSGDRNRIMLVGHSAGAHLASLVTLELALKQLVEDPESMIMSQDELDETESVDEGEVTASMSVSRQVSTLQFDDVHFSDNGDNKLSLSLDRGCGDAQQEALQSSSSSFLFVPRNLDKEGGQAPVSPNSSMLIVSDKDFSSEVGVAGDQTLPTNQLDDNEVAKPTGELDVIEDTRATSEEVVIRNTQQVGEENVADSAPSTDQLNDRDSIEVKETSESSDTDNEAPTHFKVDTEDESGIKLQGDDDVGQEDKSEVDLDIGMSAAADLTNQSTLGMEFLSESQTEARNLLSTIKVVVGLAGVYDIGEHYEFEYWRGVEDVSKMTRAMYGPEHFDRFSPTVIVQSLPQNTRLPVFHLIHGGQDRTVPVQSSNKFCAALSHMGCRRIYMTEVPQCGHYEVCLDLMEPTKRNYVSVMSEIMRSFNKFLT